MSILLLLALALAPGASIAVFIYIKDTPEREPVPLLLKSFFFGFVAIVVTFVLSLPFEMLFTIEDEDLVGQGIRAFLIVALVEELSKFLFLRGVLYYDNNFNEPFDGIVYSVMIGMGFATLENIFYVIEGGVSTAVLRMFTAVPAHATFAVLMGYFVGKAKFRKNGTLLSIYGLLTATLFHGAYDFFFFINFVPGMGLGAIASLIVGIVLSMKAMRMHQEISPFQVRSAVQNLEPVLPDAPAVNQNREPGNPI